MADMTEEQRKQNRAEHQQIVTERLLKLTPYGNALADAKARQQKQGGSMTEEQANVVAEALGGDVWNSGGDVLLVTMQRADGKVVAISSDVVCVYDSMEDLQSAEPKESIVLH